MAALLERHIPLRTVVAISDRQAHALGDPARVAMLDLMASRPMSVDDLVVELRRRGLNKAPTTVRYHLEQLKRAELVELAILRGARGAALRYYAATTRALHYELPQEEEVGATALATALSTELEPSLRSYLRRHSRQVRRMAERLRPCPHCPIQHFEEYVILSLVQRAMADLIQRRTGLGGGSDPSGRSRRLSTRARDEPDPISASRSNAGP